MKWVPYASFFGSLMYAMVSTRPDVMGVLSRFMENLSKSHWDSMKNSAIFERCIIVCVMLSR